MAEPNLFLIFVSRINTTGIRYIVTGAVASIIYGEPRLTHDIDLVLEMSIEDTEKIAKAFQPVEFYCPPVEIIKLEIMRPFRGHFNIIHHETGFKADVYTAGQDELHRWAIENRRKLDIEGETIWLAPPEYVIIRKLEYYREAKSEKHLRDIASMIEISSDQINLKELRNKIKHYALEEEWQKVQEIIKSPEF